MFERFIVATDLSPASFAVVSCLSGLKAALPAAAMSKFQARGLHGLVIEYSTGP